MSDRRNLSGGKRENVRNLKEKKVKGGIRRDSKGQGKGERR